MKTNIFNSNPLKFILYSFVLFILLAPSCKKEQEAEKVDFEIAKAHKWYFSNEENSGDTVYFRPEGYEFPRSRGRESFELSEEVGKMKYYAISPTDFPVTLDASWKFENDMFTIVFPDDEFIKRDTYQFKIIEISDKMMKTVMIY